MSSGSALNARLVKALLAVLIVVSGSMSSLAPAATGNDYLVLLQQLASLKSIDHQVPIAEILQRYQSLFQEHSDDLNAQLVILDNEIQTYGQVQEAQDFCREQWSDLLESPLTSNLPPETAQAVFTHIMQMARLQAGKSDSPAAWKALEERARQKIESLLPAD